MTWTNLRLLIPNKSVVFVVMKFFGLILLTATVSASPLLGSKKCTWGPSYWCSHINHAKECGAVQHCITTVWQNQRMQVKSDETCTYCMLLVEELRSALENKATEDEISKDISDACNLLPAGINRDVCKGIVTDDLPIVMQILLSKITPSVACTAVGFCSVYEEQKPRTEFTTLVKVDMQTPCDDCLKFLTDVQDAVTSNETIFQLEQILHDVVCLQLGPLQQECDDLVKQFLPVALGFIADEIDPNVFCRAIGFCVLDTQQSFKLPLKNVFANRPPVPLKYRSSEECEICKDIFAQIVDLMRDKTYQDKAKYLIENDVCSQLGYFSDKCKQLVEEYFPELLELLVNELNPTTVCETIGFCKVPNGSLKSEPVLKMFPAQHASGDLECTVCEMITQELDNLLKQNQTLQTLEDLVGNICKRLPDETLASKCEDFVNQYGQDILDFLLQELSPREMCTKLGLCNKQTVELTKSGGSPMKDDAKCTLCKFVIKEIKNVLDNMTTEEILSDLEKVCMLLSGNLSAMCFKYVKDNGPFAVELLRNSEPEVICGLMKACGTADAENPMFMAPIPEKTVKENKETVTVPCEVCDTVLTVLKMLVTQNMTEEEIEQLLEKICDEIPPTLKEECDALIQKYGKDIISYLLQELKPYTICQKIGLCKESRLPLIQPMLAGILSPFDTLPLQVSKTEGRNPWKGETSCDMCKMVFDAVDDFLGQNSTEEEIRKSLDTVCQDVLPKFLSLECESLVDTNIDVILNYIMLNIDAEVICKLIELCPSNRKVPEPVHVKLLKDTTALYRQLGLGSTECDLCRAAIKELDSILQENATEQEIEAALLKVCSHLPSNVSVECIAFIKEYGRLVLDLLIREISPDQICTELGLCKRKPQKSMVPVVYMVGSKPADYLERENPECEGCKVIINTLKPFVNSNMTVEEIENLLKKICDILPDTITEQCHDIVEMYVPAILDLLKEDLNATQICKKIGFCSLGGFKYGKSATLSSSKKADKLYFKPREKECTDGPWFWCANEENAKKCNAWEHCERYVWNRH